MLGVALPTLGPTHEQRVQAVNSTRESRLLRLLIQKFMNQAMKSLLNVVGEKRKQPGRGMAFTLHLCSSQLIVPKRGVAGINLNQIMNRQQVADTILVDPLRSSIGEGQCQE